jgi:hypothetical protein
LPELETLEQALPTLLEAWPAVRVNFSTLHSSDVAQQEAVLTLRVDLSHHVDAMESKICRVVTLMGDRPESVGTSSVWKAITELNQVIVPILDDQQVSQEAVRQEAVGQIQSVIKTVRDLVSSTEVLSSQLAADSPLSATLTDFGVFFSRYSSSVNSPGDLLEERFKALTDTAGRIGFGGNLVPEGVPTVQLVALKSRA